MDVSLLTTKGQELLKMKILYSENDDFELIQKGLAEAFSKEPMITDGLYNVFVNKNISPSQFERILLGIDQFVNIETNRKLLLDLSKKMEILIKNETKSPITFDIDNNGIFVLKKLGISQSFFQREFFLTEEEAYRLFHSPFAEQYATLKLNALTRKIRTGLSKEAKRLLKDYLSYTISPIYVGVFGYNIDVVFHLSLTKQTINTISNGLTRNWNNYELQEIVKTIAAAIEFLSKRYFEVM